MKRKSKKFVLIIIPLVLIIGYCIYLINKSTIVAESQSKDKKYIVSFIETKSAVFFGPSEVKILLETNEEVDKKIYYKQKQEINTLLYNDGKSLSEDNWKIKWRNNYVEITLKGEEQEDQLLRLYFVQ